MFEFPHYDSVAALIFILLKHPTAENFGLVIWLLLFCDGLFCSHASICLALVIWLGLLVLESKLTYVFSCEKLVPSRS